MTDEALIGALLSDRFRIVRKIENDGLNELYAGEDLTTRKPVFVKFVYSGYLNTQRAEARFREDMNLVQELGSPHVARVLDLGVTEEGSPFLVSEFLQGSDLKDLLGREGRLELGRAVDLAIQALRGLGAAHERGLLHLNVKPENLFVAKSSRAGEVCKVLDFGFAKVRVSRFWRHLEPEMRSLVYSAPERLDEEVSADQRADLYSIAAVLYECLCGRAPHAAREETALIQQIRTEKPVRIDVLRPGLPPGLSELVHRGLSSSPARRFGTAGEFIRALEPFALGKLVEPKEAVVASAEVKRDRPRAWSKSSVLGGAAALGLLSYYYLSRAPAPEATPEAVLQPSAVPKQAAPPAASSAAAKSQASAAPVSDPRPVTAPAAAISAKASVAAASTASSAAHLAAPSASAGPSAVLCYLNRVSGVVSTRGPGCRNASFAKPNMTNRDKFPKWIPPYCAELAVFHCEAAPDPEPQAVPPPRPQNEPEQQPEPRPQPAEAPGGG